MLHFLSPDWIKASKTAHFSYTATLQQNPRFCQTIDSLVDFSSQIVAGICQLFKQIKCIFYAGLFWENPILIWNYECLYIQYILTMIDGPLSSTDLCSLWVTVVEEFFSPIFQGCLRWNLGQIKSSFRHLGFCRADIQLSAVEGGKSTGISNFLLP